MFYWDRTKAGTKNRHSGLDRVAKRLSEEFALQSPGAVSIIRWDQKLESYVSSDSGEVLGLSGGDIVICSEVFSFSERLGYESWCLNFRGKRVMIFHDAIPLQYPDITWPHSVARHPYYLLELANCWKVLCVSEESAEILRNYWAWAGIQNIPEIKVIELGADSLSAPSSLREFVKPPRFSFLMTGILEPRKNQNFILNCCEILWEKGLEFDLHIVGRRNPHFGRKLYKKIQNLGKKYSSLKYHGSISDQDLDVLYDSCQVLLFPSLVEGFGLPVVESLSKGLPVLSSAIPSATLYESRGVVVLDPQDQASWCELMSQCVLDDIYYNQLKADIDRSALKTWSDTAKQIKDAICPDHEAKMDGC